MLALAAIASLMCALDTLVVSTALTSIRTDLGASPEALEWTVNAYNLALAVLLVPAAAIGDRFGRRRMFGVGLVLFVVASAACALAPDVAVLSVARGVQGAGAALVTALGMALVGAAYPAEERGAALGTLQGITGLAILAGPELGGVVTDLVGWEGIFWLNVPIGLVVLPMVFRGMADDERQTRTMRLDVAGVALVSVGALGIVWGLSCGNVTGWTAPDTLAAFVVGIAALVLFLRRQARVPSPVVPLHLFRAPGFVAGNLATIGLFASIFGGVFFYSQLLQTGLGFTPLQAGLGLMPWTCALFVLAPIAGKLADRIGNRPVVVVGLALAALGATWIALVNGPGMQYSDLVAPFLVNSVGASMAMPALASAVLGGVRSADMGSASGVTNMMRELGGVLGLAVLVAVFSATGSYASAGTFVDGFRPTVLVCAGLITLGTVAAVFLRRRAATGTEENGSEEHPDAAPGNPAPREPTPVG